MFNNDYSVHLLILTCAGHFKNEYFFTVLDQEMSSLSRRFKQLKQFDDYFSSLFGIGIIKRMKKI